MLSFFVWHYSSGIKKFLEIWRNFLEFFGNFFSIGRLLKSLFSPWKRDVSRVGRPGIHPLLFFQAMFENLFTRFIGAIVKIGVIIAGIIFEALVLLVGLFSLCVWLVWPILFPASLILQFYVLDIPEKLILLAITVSCFGLLVISTRSFISRNNDYLSMSYAELSRQKWFERIWNRLGMQKKGADQSIMENEEKLGNFLHSLDLSLEDFKNIISWEIGNQIRQRKKRSFWLRENLMTIQPIGKHWRYAYTNHLDKYSDDISERDFSEYQTAELIGGQSELEEIKRILLRPGQNNVILVGEFGVGKHTIVHTFAKEIREGRSLELFENKRVIQLDIKSIIADHASQGNIEVVLNNLFSEAAYAGNIIMVLDDIHEYLDSSGSGGYDISPILSNFLNLPTFQIIGITTPSEFHSKIEKKSNIMKYCEKVFLEEMDDQATFKTLLYELRDIEKNKIIFTYQALREIIEASDRYITDSPFPEKALDLMEEVIIYWEGKENSPLITKEIVDRAVSAKINVPLGEIKTDEREKLLNLEKLLHQRIVGQDLAVRQIAETMRRSRVGMTSKNKPLGSFLFLGPTGVGKTESAKALAEAYFGSDERMIRLDMSEYQTQLSIDHLIGSTINGQEGILVSKVKENPYALLLLDEIEKAYPDLLNIFLQVLDEGSLTDAFGKKISFRNLIIIATSNAGSEIIRQGITDGLGSEEIKKRVTDYVIQNRIFRPELLNRFEDVIFFHPISPEDMQQVTVLLLRKYAEKLKEQNNMRVVFDEAVASRIIQLGYDPVFGARAIDRYIQDKIGDKIAKAIIAKNIKRGDTFNFTVADLEDE